MTIIQNYLLFNHTYLRQLQADGSIDDQAADVAQGVRDWYEFRDASSTQTLVASWIDSMLNLLELSLQPLSLNSQQPNSPLPYLLYSDYDSSKPVGLCYVTPPGANLDETTKGHHWMAQAVLAARNWSRSIENEEEQNQNASLRWVILTNGDQWRLLDAQSLRRYEAYLQVDLGEMARDQSDLTALRVFYQCFHRTAFISGSDMQSGLDNLLNDSERATERAERHLKAKMEEVLGNLCRGFVAADRRQGKTGYTDSERDIIFADATYLLYRILFILYAEARSLLPVERAEYRQVGMQALAEHARRYKLDGIPDLNATTLWDQLKYLCDAIYGAEHEPEHELGIPAYDGDLFENANHAYLAHAAITDQFLTDALFDLTYLPLSNLQSLISLDYRDLSVRHLGSLYEGMLEYKLFVVEQPMLARRDNKGNVSYLLRSQVGSVKKTDHLIEPGEVYFSQSPAERKATGSYYTPEYIVDYIVQQTVWVGLSERRHPLELQLAKWQTELSGALDEVEYARLQRTIDQALLNFVEEQVFTFRVCDPAMGSGHFLVNATLTIANFIVETLHLDGTHHALPITEHALTTDPTHWRRQLVERCIYGVDLNPLGVELAKLSLWFVTVTWGKPLSFLNHHLRHGNSLVGARLEELVDVLSGKKTNVNPSRREQQAQAAGQMSMFDDPAFSQHLTTATNLLERITTQVAETVAEVKAQAGDYEQVRDELAPYRRLANILTARHFGLIVDGKQLKEMAKHLTTSALSQFPAFQRLIEAAQRLAEEYDFFHWELEFPELFFDDEGHYLNGEAGFQAVIGNPPYIRSGELAPIKTCLAAHYLAIYHGSADIFVYFFGQGLWLLQNERKLSYISSNSWLRASYAEPLRKYLRTEVTIERLVDLGDNRAFPEVPDVYPAIPLLCKATPPAEHVTEAAVFSRGEGLSHFERQLDTKLFSGNYIQDR